MPHMAVVYVTPNCHQCGIYDNVDAGAAFGILTHFPVSLRLNKFQFRGKWVLCLHLSVALIHIFLFNFIYLKFSNFFYRVDRFQRLRYAIRWFRNDFVINKKKFVHTNQLFLLWHFDPFLDLNSKNGLKISQRITKYLKVG